MRSISSIRLSSSRRIWRAMGSSSIHIPGFSGEYEKIVTGGMQMWVDGLLFLVSGRSNLSRAESLLDGLHLHLRSFIETEFRP
jgi:hypothetical protein